MQIKNFTPHTINIVIQGEETVSFPSVGVARVGSTPGQEIETAGAPCPLFTSPTWGEVTGLPAPAAGVLLVVSALVAARCVGRGDVFSPGTGPNDGAIRDEKGQIVAVTRLIQAPQT